MTASKVLRLVAAVICIVAIGIMSLPAFAENTVKGKLTVDGKSVEIKHVLAYSQPGTFDKKKKDVVVLMCDEPVSLEVAKDPFGIGDQVKEGKLHCVRNTIDAGKQVINFEVSHNSFRMPVGGGSSFEVFEPKTFTKSSVAGRSFTKSPQKAPFSEVVYSYDITFSADIASPQSRKVGKKLPAGGGEMFKAYLALKKKLKTMSLKELRETMPKEMAEQTSDEELKMMQELAVAMMPKNPKYGEGYVNGDKSVLFLTDHAGKEKRYGIVDMNKEKDQWTVEKESWSDNPPE